MVSGVDKYKMQKRSHKYLKEKSRTEEKIITFR